MWAWKHFNNMGCPLQATPHSTATYREKAYVSRWLHTAHFSDAASRPSTAPMAVECRRYGPFAAAGALRCKQVEASTDRTARKVAIVGDHEEKEEKEQERAEEDNRGLRRRTVR